MFSKCNIYQGWTVYGDLSLMELHIYRGHPTQHKVCTMSFQRGLSQGGMATTVGRVVARWKRQHSTSNAKRHCQRETPSRQEERKKVLSSSAQQSRAEQRREEKRREEEEICELGVESRVTATQRKLKSLSN
jgi:hypothetical protein